MMRHFGTAALAALIILSSGPAAQGQARPKPKPRPTAKAPPVDTKAYCKKMYGSAYMLCGMSDHDCKFLAADKWDRCLKTGRWPA